MLKSWLSILDRLEVPPLEKNSVLWIESIVQNFETETGIILPEGYKEFCRVFGAGIFGSYVQIFYPSLVYSQRFIGFFKDRLQSQNKSSSITSKTLENLLDSAFIFGSNANGEYFLWDLKTYCQSDRSYDIYLVPHNLEDTYFIGRTFLNFICNFCLGMKAYDILPEDLQPFPQELCHEFHRFPLPRNENETFSEEEKIRKQKLETRENIWKRNLETGIIFKLAQTYEKQGQFVEALILYIQHPLYYLGVMEKIRLYRAFRRLHEALGETLFRQVCWAASKNITYKQLFAAMNHVWLWNAPTIIEGEQYQNFQDYHSDDRLYRACDYPEAEIISAFGHETIENLDEILIEPIPQPDAEFLQVWQSYLQSVRTHLAESSPPDEFSSEEDIWWKNMISGALWKLARSYENQGLFLETLVLYLKATHLDNFAYSEDHSERYGQFLKAIANLRDRLGDVRFCQIYRATTGYPIDVGMFEGLRADTNLSLYGNSIPDSEIIDQFPDPEPEFLQIWQNFLEFVREQLAIGFFPQEYEPREREVENLYRTALDRWCLPSDRGYVETREPADWEEKVFEEILQALRDRNCYAFFRYLRTFKNHTDSVTCVKFSPDGQILASGSADKTIKLWNLETRQEIATLAGHNNAVLSIAFSPTDSLLASGSVDTTIKIWNLAAYEAIDTIYGHRGSVTSVAITPDGQTLVSASTDTTIKLWDLHAGREIRTLTEHTSTVTSVAISPDGQTLASGSADKTVKLWELKTARMLYSFDVDAGFVFAVCFHPNNSILASVHSGPGTARTINLWNLNTKTIYRTITTYEEIVCISISPDGQTLVGGSDNTPFLSITMWDLNTGKVIVTFPAPRGSDSHKELVYSIAFSPDRKFLASGSKDTEIKLWGIPAPIQFDDIYE